MQTVASLADRLDMTPEEAVEKLQYMLFDISGVDSEIDDEVCDLLIDVDDDPDYAEKVRESKIKEQEKAKKAAERAAAKRKAAQKKKATAEKKKKAAAKTPKKKETAAEPELETAETAAPETAAPAAEVPPMAEILEPVAAEKPVAEILPTEDAEVEAPPTPEKKAKKPKEKKKKEEPSGPAIIIGSAIEHEEHRAEVVRADGTHVDVVDVDMTDAEPIADIEEEDEEVGLLAEAERRQEEEEKRKIKLAKPLAKPDPAVVAEVIRKANLKREQEPSGEGDVLDGLRRSKRQRKAKSAAAAATGGAARKTGKTARKRQKKLDKIRAEESMRRDAAAAIKEYQAGGFDTRKKRKRRRDTEEGLAGEAEEQLRIEVEDVMTVEELAKAMDYETTDIIIELMDHNIMATKNQSLSLDLIREIAEPKGFEVISVIPGEQEILSEEPDDPADLVPRAPVVTVMGHVDHGKTSLLDRVREASVAEGEAGGITQHIAAYEVELEQGRVVFLDTPGHEAFTAMRARGAKVTDVVVLVVAADDGIMPQTIEAIDHARAAEVPIVVAINKIDKPDAQPDRIRQELTRFDLTDEKWGGKTIIKDISAKMGEGVNELMELLVLETELLELKANPNKRARGAIVESEITRGMGPVAWVLVQSGTLKVGDAFLAGESYGRVRSMQNSRGEAVESAGPSTPVVVTGFSSPPDAGDTFVVVKDERVARAIVEQREELSRKRQGPAARHVTLEDFHQRMLAGEQHELNIVIKADVQGSVDVLGSSISKLGNEEVSAKIVHSGVGSVNESDVLLASASDAVIIGFHVDASPKVAKLAETEGVAIRTYRVIYEAIEDVRKALEGLLEPEKKETVTGHVEIRAIFRSSALGAIAGCYVTDGEVRRDSLVRLLRGGDVVYEGRIASLRRNKDQVAAVQTGFECGIKLENFDAIEEGDVIETYKIESVAKTLV